MTAYNENDARIALFAALRGLFGSVSNASVISPVASRQVMLSARRSRHGEDDTITEIVGKLLIECPEDRHTTDVAVGEVGLVAVCDTDDVDLCVVLYIRAMNKTLHGFDFTRDFQRDMARILADNHPYEYVQGYRSQGKSWMTSYQMALMKPRTIITDKSGS